MLPRPELPSYETVLPFSKKKIRYRPYTSKEEKILMMAAASGEADDLISAANQILKLCADVEVDTLPPIDVEVLFLKLRSVSVGAAVDLVITTDCEDDDCPTEYKTGLLLDNVEVKNIAELEKDFKRNSDGWIIPMRDNIGMVINPVDNYKDTEDEDYLWECFHSAFNGDEVFYKEDVDKSEFIEWLDAFTNKDKSNIEKFFEIQPYTYYKIDHTCKNCGKHYEIEMTGIIDFLE